MLAIQADTALVEAVPQPAAPRVEDADGEVDDFAAARGLLLGMLLGAVSLGGAAFFAWWLL